MNELAANSPRIAAAFTRALERGAAALMPYFTLGYPDRETSLDIIEAIAPYSDLLELGVPFSDPIADGPTIQMSTQIALENGTTSETCLEMVAELRRRGVKIPILLMGYYNPILAYGEQRYVAKAKEVGADGFIIPDLPPEEAKGFNRVASAAGMALVYFLTPISSEDRVDQVVELAKGFIYMVSVTGVTGARRLVRQDLAQVVTHVKNRSKLPVAVGFGISTPEQANAVGQYADGVIVGSAIIDAVDRGDNPSETAAQFVKSLQLGLLHNTPN